MGTRSGIGLLEDGKIKAVYCHWDGYVDHNGRILENSYRDVEKVRQLLALGDLSSLADNIGEKHYFEQRDPGCCTFYGRDRGETGTEAGTYNTTKEMFDGIDGEYFYLMKDGLWFVSRGDDKWTLLSVALEDDQEDDE